MNNEQPPQSVSGEIDPEAKDREVARKLIGGQPENSETETEASKDEEK